jgi:hypothetical protein
MRTLSWDPLLGHIPGRMRQSTSWRDDPRGSDMLGFRPASARPKRILLEPGETHEALAVSGPGVITRFWLTVMPWRPAHLRDVVVRCFWDGETEPSVLAGAGDFFGAPFGKFRSYQSQRLCYTGGAFTCSFPMPFASRAVVQLTNEGTKVVDPLFYALTYYELDDEPATDLRFHARWHRERATTPGEPYTILEASGTGHYVGVRMDMQNRHRWWTKPVAEAVFPYGLGLGMLEGPEHIFVDGEQAPSVSGTGTEDYFNAGWYFARTFSAPTHGCTMRNWFTGRASAFRFHVDAPVPFRESIRVTMDHGMNNVVRGDYASVAYWYQTEPHVAFPPLPAPAQRRRRSALANLGQAALVLAPLGASVVHAVRRLFGGGRRGRGS